LQRKKVLSLNIILNSITLKQLFFFLLTIFGFGCLFCQTKTKVIFKPGPTNGQDALMWTTYGCTTVGYQKPTEYINFGNHEVFGAVAWTYNFIGCPEGAIRSLLRFTELSTIPKKAVIIEAELKLYGIENYSQGNSCYPGSPYLSYCPNSSVLQLVKSLWDEQTATWNSQPSTTTDNQIFIPETTTYLNWNFTNNSVNLVTMVKEWVKYPETNYGLMLKLVNETYYRSVYFASSDHSNSALWPELIVIYEYDTTKAEFYVNNIHYQALSTLRFCEKKMDFRAEIEGIDQNPGSLKWYINDTEEIAAQDQLVWSKTLSGGEYEIKMWVRYENGETETLDTSLNIGSIISAAASPPEGGNTEGAGCYKLGETVTLTATPAEKFLFRNWTESGKIVSTNKSYSFAVTKDRNLVANFTSEDPDTLDFDTYAVIICDRVILLNLKKLEEDGFDVTGCKWFRNDIEVKETHTINAFSFAEGYDKKLLRAPNYYTFKLITSNYGELPSSKKIIIGADNMVGCPDTETSRNLLVYPNPVVKGSVVTIEGVGVDSRIYVYNHLGACVFSTVATTDLMKLTLDFPQGIYLIRNESKIVKIIVIK